MDLSLLRNWHGIYVKTERLISRYHCADHYYHYYGYYSSSPSYSPWINTNLHPVYPRDITGTMNFVSDDNNSIDEFFWCGQSFHKLQCFAAKPHYTRRPARRRRLRLHITDIKNSAKYNFYNYNYYYNIKLQLNRNKYRINFRTNFSLIKFL